MKILYNLAIFKSITLADLYHLPYGTYLKDAGASGLDSTSRPNVARYDKVNELKTPSYTYLRNF